MTPLDYYNEQCKNGLIIEDQNQLHVLHDLQLIYLHLLKEYQQRSGLLSVMRKPNLVHGVYLWGGVGIGKTFLLDCLFACLPFQNKLRMHFHQFMRLIHQGLKEHEGKKDPLKYIAADIAKKNLLLCFDEFVVTDIVDAMLLGRLFRLLFSHGVCLVTTSNVKPDDLYKNGLQRSSFLPAIALLKQHTKVIHVPSTIDYRLRYLKSAGVFYTPNDESAHQAMEKCFSILTNDESASHHPITICGREIQIKKQAGDTIWFDFDKICNIPRSQQDYLAIADKYKNILISNIPDIPPDANNVINLFIRMIDVFYDARIRLIISSEVSIDKIYHHGYLAFDFNRTRSRLLEMQSEQYFASTK